VTEDFPDWQVPAEPCHLHTPGGLDAWADVNLNGEPETGLAIDAGVSPGAVGAPGQAFPPRPVEIDPAAADTAGTADGSILIRPAQEEPEPPPLEETAPAPASTLPPAPPPLHVPGGA
jgi:hypothetical protein